MIAVTSAARTANPPVAETDFPRAGRSGWWVPAASVAPAWSWGGDAASPNV
jgi:hypothetical protein